MPKFGNESSAYPAASAEGKGRLEMLWGFFFLFFEVKAACYQKCLNMDLGVEKIIVIRRQTGFINRVYIFLLFRTVGFQSPF